MHVLPGLVRLCLLLLAFAAAALTGATATAVAQGQPACSDLIDNDSDGAIDGEDAGCGGGSDQDETDSPYAGIVLVTVPLPVVTLQGTVTVKGTVDFTRVLIRAQRGSIVDVLCTGRACPLKRKAARMITSSLRLRELERRLRAPMTLTIRIQRPGQLGKYLQYRIRRNKAPVRKDACLDQDTGEVRQCFED
jgi:hypothetical protein